MSISKTNDLGKISLDPQVISDIVYDLLDAPDLRGNLWMASGKSHIADIIPVIKKDRENSMKIAFDNDRLSLELSIVIKFGVSISNTTKLFADKIVADIKELLGLDTDSITINISGVKSKQIAKRRTRVIYRYGS